MARLPKHQKDLLAAIEQLALAATAVLAAYENCPPEPKTDDEGVYGTSGVINACPFDDLSELVAVTQDWYHEAREAYRLPEDTQVFPYADLRDFYSLRKR